MRKWDSYYSLAERKIPIDVLLVGNSHLYTGINPQNLSNSLGCNAFIIASPGTFVVDHYFAIKEAIGVHQPKLIVLETYGLRKCNPYHFNETGLSSQLKSFSARRNIMLKALSTPYLFSVKDYPYAWLNTLRNHHFIYRDWGQIQNNRKPKSKNNNSLYLGRYIRFQTGITDSILQQYTSNGSPVRGDDYQTDDTQIRYTQKIINLCKENNIELLFLTLPMYESHITNYQEWKSRLGVTLREYNTPVNWIDMQEDSLYRHIGFDTSSFENTYKSNQHMTYSGSLLATYKLSDFIQKQYTDLPQRRQDSSWQDLFYDSDGFFQNNTPQQNDSKNRLIYHSESNVLQEIIVLKKEGHDVILAKIKPKNEEEFKMINRANIGLHIIYKEGNQIYETQVILEMDRYHKTSQQLVFMQKIKPVEILNIKQVQFVSK